MSRTQTLQAYRRYLEALNNTDAQVPWDDADAQAAWDAMPLRLRVRLCWQCGWLDAVFEVSPAVGRAADLLRNGRRG